MSTQRTAAGPGARLNAAADPAHRLRTIAADWWSQAVASRLAIGRLLPYAGAALLAGSAVVNLMAGLLPVVFMVATSALMGWLPRVTAGASPAPPGDMWLVLLVAAVAFAAQQAVAPVQSALAETIKYRIDGHVRDRIMSAALRGRGIAVMEQPDALDALDQAIHAWERGGDTPGAAAAGLLALIARYTRLVALVLLIGVLVGWFAAVVLLTAVMIFRYGQRGGLRRFSRVWPEVAPIQRHATYLRDLAMGGAAAKEQRIFGLTSWLADRYETVSRRWLVTVWRRRRRIFFLPYLGYTAVGLVAALGVFLLLARRGSTGELSLAELVLGIQATVAAVLLGDHYAEADVQTEFGMVAIGGLQRFERLTAAADEPAPPAKPVPPARTVPPARPGPGPPPYRVRFDRVSFRYPAGQRPVLDGLDLALAPGRCTAVVGVNGAGKTTLVKLLTGLLEPTGGRIALNGSDLRTIDSQQWRRQISVIFQDFIRYELSVADNIALGAPHVARDEAVLRRAAAGAGILEVIDGLPLGLQTPLARCYPDGVELSGGQWQRIAIARSLYALAAGAQILVFDEPTAALDVRAETQFIDHFARVTRDVTRLLISHRFASVRHADQIVVISAGRVAEQGTHDALMASDGHYARLFRLQAERFGADLPGLPGSVAATAESGLAREAR